MRLREHPAFMLLWTASTVSSFGSYVTSLALSVIVVVNLGGNSTDVGWVNAARWLPYAALGLIVGALVEHWSKRRLLVSVDLLRGLALGLISVLGLSGLLNIPTVIALMILFGVLSLLGDVAHQSYLPILVPRGLLVKANARIEQSDAVAQTTGQLLAGLLIDLIKAPLALLVDALSYIFSALVIWRISSKSPTFKEQTPAAQSNEPPTAEVDDSDTLRVVGTAKSLRSQILEGLAAVYQQPRLRVLALSTHLWFLFNAMVGVSFTVYLLDSLKLDAWQVGLILTCAGVGAVLGTSVTTRLGQRIGPGRCIILSGVFDVAAFVLIAGQASLWPTASSGSNVWWQLWIPLVLGQLLFGFSLGLSGAHEMAYRAVVTPVRLLTRLSATMRSINRSMIVIGAPLGGFLAATLGYSWVFWIVAAGFALSRGWLWLSGFAAASYTDRPA
ncbi:MFS transporter [Psychromicrobium lacuslunae]|uniref:MFS transporter n=1 Tax=Psychromicrobium lacuslunae TaxID=1618207 RepID=UPI0005D37B99|nr:MFS transporter [Psychromicrobium lacuslunae]